MTSLKKSGIVRIIEVLIFYILFAVVFFAAAGRLDIPKAWFYFGLTAVYSLLSFVVISKTNPEIINVRGELKIVKWWDWIFIILYVLMIFLPYLVAGLDVGRFRWSNLGITSFIIGIIGLVCGSLLVQRAMMVNRFFEVAVRIQKERGHYVISSGPYKFIRHPGYLGSIMIFLSTPLVLGSCLALIPAGALVILIVIRTILEDKTLRDELEGYSVYAKKVKYRLLPGIW